MKKHNNQVLPGTIPVAEKRSFQDDLEGACQKTRILMNSNLLAYPQEMKAALSLVIQQNSINHES